MLRSFASADIAVGTAASATAATALSTGWFLPACPEATPPAQEGKVLPTALPGTMDGGPGSRPREHP